MITAINNFTPIYPATLQQRALNNVKFTGKSMPSQYLTVFDYMSAEILGRNRRVNGSMLSATKIQAAVQDLLDNNKVFTEFKRSLVEKIKWKSYIPEDVRVYSIDKINKAREARLKQWRDFLKYPTLVSENGTMHNEELVLKLRNDKSLRVVIWDAITSEIKENNRHIPVPFNEEALLETINRFERYDAKDRATSCVKPSFLEIYTHKLRDNLLMEMGLSNQKKIWVKIPSIKHDPLHKEENIARLETLSCKNWCTRSSVDKAEDALTDGDFYIYLRRNSLNLWEPLVGMTTCKGKIDQIQGIENNNIIPLNMVEEVKSFIAERGLKCASGIFDEGPKARQAILISEKLAEVNPNNSRQNFMKAIKDGDDRAMFEFLNIETNVLPDNSLEIANYKPSYTIRTGSGITIPYSMLGINENELLRNVRVINGNLILHNKDALFNSNITVFPPKLEKVKGRIVCTAEQYEKFKDDINRVIKDQNHLIIRSK